MSDVVLVLSTVADDDSAESIAQTLVEEQLVACANLLPPMTSIYRWRGHVERDSERQLILKTTKALVPALEKRLKELHSFELPEFIVISLEGSAPYLSWVVQETKELA